MRPEAILEHFDHGTPWPPDRPPRDDVQAAYRDALAVRALRIDRGERPVGYKIGFTNRTIWQRYRVFAPIWGSMWDTGVVRSDGRGVVDLAHTCQPRIEPEIVFGFATTPTVDGSLDDLFDCIAWLAPGFEIVQSHVPDWRFTAAETIADGALHARLLIGEPTPVGVFATSGGELDARLGLASMRLLRDDRVVDGGTGRDVLDGPLHALHHFVRELGDCHGGPRVQPGDVVTTGTWTDAWPVEPGQTWHAAFDAPFRSLTATFASA